MVANPYINLNDKELMLKYQNGDHMAFDVLYMRHKDKVYSYLANRLHSKNEIDDLFQKVFVKFHKSRHLYKEKYDVLPWFYTITKSEFLDFIKKKNISTQEYDEKLHSPIEQEQKMEINIESEKQLTDKEKTAIDARYMSDKDFSEISELLNTSESNVRKIISRGLKKLKDKYKGRKHE